MHAFPYKTNKSNTRSTNLNEFLYFAHKYGGAPHLYGYAPAGRYGYGPAGIMGMHLQGIMGLRGDIQLQCEERLHALSNLLGFRDASFEFGDAFGIAWVCAEEVAAS